MAFALNDHAILDSELHGYFVTKAPRTAITAAQNVAYRNLGVAVRLGPG